MSRQRRRSAGWRTSLALLAAIALAACSADRSSPAAGPFTPGRPGVLTVATSLVPSPGFWEGTVSHPTGGLEYELARDLAKRFGLKAVRIELVAFDRLVSGHLGNADLALDLITPTAQRAQVLEFSDPYLDAAPTVVVRSGTQVPDLATAQGLRWGVVRGTTFVDIIANSITPDQPARLYADSQAVLIALREHKIDATVLDMPLAVVAADRSAGALQAVAQLPTSESIAAALPEGSGNVDAVSSAMRAFIADGTIDQLLSQWVGAEAANEESSIPLLQTTR